MIHKYISKIDPTDGFIYATIVLGSVLLQRRIQLSSTTLVGLIAGLIVVFYLNDKKTDTGANFLEHMDRIRKAPIFKPHKNPNLHRDSVLLSFLDQHRIYYQYNPAVFNDLIAHVNSFLTLIHDIDIGTENYNSDYEVVRKLRTDIMNTYHSFIYRIPHAESSLRKFHLGMDRLEEILNGHIDRLHRDIVRKNQKDGIMISSKFHYLNQPQPRDHGHIRQYHYYT